MWCRQKHPILEMFVRTPARRWSPVLFFIYQFSSKTWSRIISHNLSLVVSPCLFSLWRFFGSGKNNCFLPVDTLPGTTVYTVKFKVSFFPVKEECLHIRRIRLCPACQGHVDYKATGTTASPPLRLSLSHTHSHSHRCRGMQLTWGEIMCITMCIMAVMSANGLIIWDCPNDNNDAPGIVTSQNRARDGCH